MATIRKLRSKWQAQVRIKGIKPIARSFDRKADAVNWGRLVESQAAAGTYVDPRAAQNTTLSALIDLYTERQVSSGKISRPNRSRLKRLRNDLGAFSLNRISTYILSGYRDQRLLSANPATVHHELSLLTRLLRYATSDLGISLPQGVPVIGMPKMPRGRVRRISQDEEKRLFAAAKDDQEMHDIISLAIECATRRSELLSVEKSDVDLDRRTMTLRNTKNGLVRVVPLSKAALAILERRVKDEDNVFSLKPAAVSQRFAALCRRAGILDLRIHDARHESISRLFEMGLSTVEVAAISGHQSLAMLQRYTHINPEHLVTRLDGL